MSEANLHHANETNALKSIQDAFLSQPGSYGNSPAKVQTHKAKFKSANYNLIQRRDDEIARKHHLRNMSAINSKNTKVTVKKAVENAE